jgi:hypothetical protein
MVTFTSGGRGSFILSIYKEKREKEMHNFFYVIKQLKNQSTPQRQVIATTLFVFVFDI